MKRIVSQLIYQILALLLSGSSTVWAQQLSDNSSLPVITVSHLNNTLTNMISLSRERPILIELVQQSGILPTLSTNKSYTFFAPTEEALKELQYEGAENLYKILQHHIVVGSYKLTDLKDGAKLPTLGGDSIIIFRKIKAVSVNSIRINNSQETETVGTMVIHTIADLIKPKNLE